MLIKSTDFVLNMFKKLYHYISIEDSEEECFWCCHNAWNAWNSFHFVSNMYGAVMRHTSCDMQQMDETTLDDIFKFHLKIHTFSIAFL